MRRTLPALFVFLSLLPVRGQIFAGLDQVICENDSVTLGASVAYVSGTALSMTDDVYSGVIDIGFDFSYFGDTYSKVLFSSNNYITFDTTNANGYSNWTITGPAPTPGNTPQNAIMGPWQDINPGVTGPGVNGVLYGTYGPPGQQVFITAFCEVPMFSCTNLLYSSQIKLFESDNHIEMHIQSKPLCTTWNGGQAIQGITNSDLSTTVIIPGRNAPGTWNANQDGYAFFPAGNTYIDYPIPFSPTIFSAVAPTVEWYDSTGVLVGVGDTIQVLPPPGGMTYYASVFICGAQQTISDTVNVQVPDLGSWDVNSVICAGDSTGSIIWSGPVSTPPLTYEWSTGDTSNSLTGLAAGTYYVTVTDEVLDCSRTDTLEVPEADSLLLSSVIEPDKCNNSLGRVIPNITGGIQPYQFLWSNGATSDTLSNVPAGTYTLSYTDSLGCTQEGIFTVTNDDFTILVDSLLVLPEACNQADGYIAVSASGGTPPYSYQWSNGLSGATQDSLVTGTYTVTVTDVNNCQSVVQFYIPSHLSPIPGFAGPDSVRILDYATFFDTTQAIAGWLWQFGDGNSGIDSVVTHMYRQEGEYLVQLTVTDSFGCSATSSKTVFVLDEFYCYVPNAFTPNQDGVNEIFLPVIIGGADPNTYTFQIFSRNGQMVFESDDLMAGWDGLVHDEQGAQTNVYTWRLYFRTFSGREVIKYGTVALIR